MLRRVRQWVGEQLAFLVVLVVLGAAFAYLLVEPDEWRPGSGVIAGAVLFAGVLRAVLPSDRVGMLAVRLRLIDTVVYLALGGLILAVDIRMQG